MLGYRVMLQVGELEVGVGRILLVEDFSGGWCQVGGCPAPLVEDFY